MTLPATRGGEWIKMALQVRSMKKRSNIDAARRIGCPLQPRDRFSGVRGYVLGAGTAALTHQ